MLKNRKMGEKPPSEELKERLKAARQKLWNQQMVMKEHKLPVIVLMEGWGTAGKGSCTGQVIQNIDPRFFRAATLEKMREEEKRKPFLSRYFAQIPEAGKFVFLDSGWMEEVTGLRLRGKLEKKEYEMRLDSIRRFERQLTDNGYLVMKFFFHISKKEQKKRIKNLLEDIDTAWRVGANDKWQNKHYEKCMEVFEHYLEMTNAPSGIPALISNNDWHLLPVQAVMQVAQTSLQALHLFFIFFFRYFHIERDLIQFWHFHQRKDILQQRNRQRFILQGDFDPLRQSLQHLEFGPFPRFRIYNIPGSGRRIGHLQIVFENFHAFLPYQ